jgi:hypothetical protein
MSNESLIWFILPIAFVIMAAELGSQLTGWWDNRLVKAPKCCICGNTNWKWTRWKSKSNSSPLCSDRCYGVAFEY